MFGFVLEQTEHVLSFQILLKFILPFFIRKRKLIFDVKDSIEVPSETSILEKICFKYVRYVDDFSNCSTYFSQIHWYIEINN